MPIANTQGTPSKLAAQAARTRARLIETTLKLLTKHDFHRLSLDAVAAQAGVTKGAIYGHFESKDALLMAALATQPSARPDTMVWPRRKGTVKQRLRQLGERVLAQQRQSGPAATRAAEFMLYALTQEAMKPIADKLVQRTRKGLEANIRALFAPEELNMPVESFAIMLGALIPGLMFTRAIRGGQTDDKAILAMFEGLA